MPRWVPPEPGRQARLGVPAPHNDFTHSCLLPAFNAARGASTAFEVTILSIDKEAPNPGLIRIERDPGASVAVRVLEATANADD
jgi:hypothetical protein